MVLMTMYQSIRMRVAWNGVAAKVENVTHYVSMLRMFRKVHFSNFRAAASHVLIRRCGPVSRVNLECLIDPPFEI
jgi:hypothetical protein